VDLLHLLLTVYSIKMDTFNYAPIALGVVLGLIMLWWVVDARKWFKGPVRNIDEQVDHNGDSRELAGLLDQAFFFLRLCVCICVYCILWSVNLV
jgi:hypothetical protein